MLPLHERLHDDAFDFDGPADWGAYDDYESLERRPCSCPFDDAGVPLSDGCKNCNPVDGECKPTGFGIERYEDPALQPANDYAASLWIGGPYQNYSAWPGLRKDARDRRWAETTQHDADLYRRSERVWDGICGFAKNHAEAVRRYEAWVKRAKTSR